MATLMAEKVPLCISICKNDPSSNVICFLSKTLLMSLLSHLLVSSLDVA